MGIPTTARIHKRDQLQIIGDGNAQFSRGGDGIVSHDLVLSIATDGIEAANAESLQRLMVKIAILGP